MSKVRVAAFSISLDGFGAGVEQSLKNPLGLRGPEIFKWFFATKTFQQMHDVRSAGNNDVGRGVDEGFAARSFENVGAWIMGRNMFSPGRGEWDETWRGWWGEDPPYHVPVFVLTHFPRPPLAMQGGTTFHFVTDGIEAALEAATSAAGGKDVRIGGGTATIRQYLSAGLIDSLHLAMSPVLLGQGESLLSGLDMATLGYTQVQVTPGEQATHIVIEKDKKA